MFSVIQLAEALEYHGHLLDEETRERWKARIAKAAAYLEHYKEFEVCNVNYPVSYTHLDVYKRQVLCVVPVSAHVWPCDCF